ELHGGRAHGTWRRWDERGALLEESDWKDGERARAYHRVGVAPGFYQDDRVFEERGSFAGNLTTGRWSVYDRDGELLRTLDLGSAVDEGALAARPGLGP